MDVKPTVPIPTVKVASATLGPEHRQPSLLRPQATPRAVIAEDALGGKQGHATAAPHHSRVPLFTLFAVCLMTTTDSLH